jgi:hypothetical protein
MLRKDFCIHYNGHGMKTHCLAGVEYKRFYSVVDDRLMLPCAGKGVAPPCEVCSSFRLPTKEEVDEHNDQIRESLERMMKARTAIIDHCGNRKSVAGSITCPVCGSGTLNYTRAFNGHVHAKCSTENCVAWME